MEFSTGIASKFLVIAIPVVEVPVAEVRCPRLIQVALYSGGVQSLAVPMIDDHLTGGTRVARLTLFAAWPLLSIQQLLRGLKNPPL
jgi:hypothetical protein